MEITIIYGAHNKWNGEVGNLQSKQNPGEMIIMTKLLTLVYVRKDTNLDLFFWIC